MGEPDILVVEGGQPEPFGVGGDDPVEAEEKNKEEEADPEPAVGPPGTAGRTAVAWSATTLVSSLVPASAVVFFKGSAECFGNVHNVTAH